jgi:outer membrane lipoprotein-sorting protein
VTVSSEVSDARSAAPRRRTGMTRWLPVLAVLLLPVATPWTSARAGAPLAGDERARAIERLQARQREVKTLRATVVQRKRHPLLKGEAVTEGTLLFSRPNHVRWEVSTPERTIIVIDDQALVVYRPERREAERRDLRDDFGSRAVVDFLRAGMTLDVAEMEKRFRVDLYRDDGRLTLVLTPRSRWVGQAIAAVTMTHSEEEAVPRQIVVVGQKGDSTETSLANLVVNPPLAEDAFALRLGPEVRVVEARRAAQDNAGGR